VHLLVISVFVCFTVFTAQLRSLLLGRSNRKRGDVHNADMKFEMCITCGLPHLTPCTLVQRYQLLGAISHFHPQATLKMDVATVFPKNVPTLLPN
jgi:hypothetical protein